MINIIIGGIIAVILIVALMKSMKNFKGDAVCCGSDAGLVKPEKKKLDKVVTEKDMVIDGMTCSNCSARVENALNGIDSVKAKVNLHKKQAHIQMSEPVDDDILRLAVEKAGYKVVSIS